MEGESPTLTIFFMLTLCTGCTKIWNYAVSTTTISHTKVMSRTKIMWVTKKYVVARKKIMWHPKERPMLTMLNMFSVVQKINTCWQKIVPVVYKYMLCWLKKFCVARKLVCIKVINFCQNGAPYNFIFITQAAIISSVDAESCSFSSHLKVHVLLQI